MQKYENSDTLNKKNIGTFRMTKTSTLSGDMIHALTLCSNALKKRILHVSRHLHTSEVHLLIHTRL